MSSDLIQRLNLAMTGTGKSARAISLLAGMSQDAVRGILRHPEASPTLETVQKLARALGCSEEWLAFGVGDPLIDSKDAGLTTLHIVGEVAAGLWTDVSEFSFEPIPYEVPADPRFPIKAQYLLRVRGNSINRKAPEGSLIRCLNLHSAPRKPFDGDWVVVERRRPEGTIETTVKKLVIDRASGAKELWPDSDDPAFQKPIQLAEKENDEIHINAFVLEFITPATRL